MKIIVEPRVMAFLETCVAQAQGHEVSGFGFVNLDRTSKNFVVYDAVLLDIGSWGFTQIEPGIILPLLDRPDAGHLKLWFHKHPMGSGIPGPENWSATDNATCRESPLGSSPELVKWSISIVRTPSGWVGRYDVYGAQGSTTHLEVDPSFGKEVDRRLAEIERSKRKSAEPKPTPHYVNDQEFEDPNYYFDDDWEIEQEEEQEWGGPLLFGLFGSGGIWHRGGR